MRVNTDKTLIIDGIKQEIRSIVNGQAGQYQRALNETSKMIMPKAIPTDNPVGAEYLRNLAKGKFEPSEAVLSDLKEQLALKNLPSIATTEGGFLDITV